MTMANDQNMRFMRALLSLEGLSVGDALGERFFFRGSRAPIMIARRELPPRTHRQRFPYLRSGYCALRPLVRRPSST